METREDLQHNNKRRMIVSFINSVMMSFLIMSYSPTGMLRIFMAVLNIIWIISFARGIHEIKEIQEGKLDFLLDDDWEE